MVSLLMVVGTFGIGSTVMFAFIAYTTSEKWHNKNHKNRSELICDHCRARKRNDVNAPPMRIIGEKRIK